MLIGLVSDAHGNPFGLERCITKLEEEKVDRIFFLGDAVNYFSGTKEVLDLLKSKDIVCIKGNHEEIINDFSNISSEIQKVYNLKLTLSVLDKDDFEFISGWKDNLELEINNLRILCVHGSPLNFKKGYIYPDTPIQDFANLGYDYIFLGHTHIPFIRRIDRTFVINVGSAGLPRLQRYVNYIIFDTKTRHVAIGNIDFPYDMLEQLKPFHKKVDDVIKRIR